MGKLVTIGLAKIEVGEIGTNGVMGTSLETIGHTAEGSCTIETADPEITEFFVEELDEPIHTAAKMAVTTITFQLASPDLEQCKAVFGGDLNPETGTPTSWDYPSGLVTIEKSVKITPKEGLIFSIPRAKITAKFTGQFGRSETLKVEVVITVLKPTGNVAPMILSLV
ncbi:hypothetical protein [Emticicia sp. TH156]|uniref:hypothetical protein n=1 Tax=Emticicia sp. TH156 TaxID=2067454 RepID=UPI000C78835D|nr:hypothetical protein [Emticicia sp. TH156]PLK44406.1 hypothetical protein C0V77_11515 [Emticicia sp. TH156]